MLREYALAADGERGALIGPHGELVWMCAPQWHCDAVFSALIGGPEAYAVTPPTRGTCGRLLRAGQLDLVQPMGQHRYGDRERRARLATLPASAEYTDVVARYPPRGCGAEPE